MKSTNELIGPCLVPFSTYSRPDGKVIYAAPEIDMHEVEILHHFAWNINPAPLEQSNESKVFYAERYGGFGVGAHGGGARCGYDGGQFQVKGIGANPLLGIIDEDSSRQADGKLSMVDAFYEMIWSRILENTLPFGVNRCMAIIGIYPSDASPNREQALLVREICIRPAHLERAAYFRTLHQNSLERSRDVQRVSKMCANLPEILCFALGVRSDCNNEIVPEGLCEFARRQAHQLAFARAHFMYHSVSSSNLCYDGRWLDFTSMSVLDPLKISKEHGWESVWPSLWEQEFWLSQILSSQLFYYGKYQHLPDSIIQSWSDKVMGEFRQELEVASTLYMLCTAGVPLLIAKDMCTDITAQKWTSLFIDALKILVGTANSDVHEEKVRIVDLTFSASAFINRDSIFYDLPPVQEYLKYRETLREKVIYSAGQYGISGESLTVAMTINAIKFSQKPDELFYNDIMENIENYLGNQKVAFDDRLKYLHDWSEKIILTGHLHFTFEPDTITSCWQDKSLSVRYDMKNENFLISGDEIKSVVPHALAHAYFAQNSQLSPCLDFYHQRKAALVFGG